MPTKTIFFIFFTAGTIVQCERTHVSTGDAI